MLKAKFSPPLLPSVIERPRLLLSMNSVENGRGLWIAAGPGTGKTTLARQYLDTFEGPSLWWRLDGRDGTAAGFFDSAATLFDAVIPGHGSPAFESADAGDHQVGEAFCRDFFAQLFSQLPPNFCWVLDDYHQLGPEDSAHEWLAIAFDLLPPEARMVILSRKPPAGVWLRRLANRELRLLDQEDHQHRSKGEALWFTEAELQAFCEQQGMDQARRDYLLRSSEGWIAAAVLLERPGDPSQHQRLFEYLDKEDLSARSRAERQLLLELSLLPSFTAANAAQLLDRPEEELSQQLEALRGQLHFMTRVALGDGRCEYRFHPLYRRFLGSRAAEQLGESHINPLRLRAAEMMLAARRIEEAAELLAAAQAWPALVSLCEDNTRHLVAGSASPNLALWLQKIPAALMQAHPWLLIARGRILAGRDNDGANALFQQALNQFLERDDTAGLYLAWAGVGAGYAVSWGDLKTIDEHCQLLLEIRRRHPDFGSVDIHAVVLTSLLWCLSWRQPAAFHYPDLERECDELLAELTSATLRLRLCTGLLWHHCVYGKSGISGQIEVLMNQELANPHVDPSALVHALAVKTLYLSMAGEAESGLALLANAQAIGVDAGLDGGKSLSISRTYLHLLAENLAAAEQGLGDLGDLASMRELELTIYQICRAWLLCARQQFVSARPVLQAGAKNARRLGYSPGIGVCEFLLIFVEYATGTRDEAYRALERLRQHGEDTESIQTEFKIRLASAWLGIQERVGEEELRQRLQAALSYGRRHQVINYFGKLNVVLSQVYSQALHLGVEEAYTRSLITAQSVAPDDLGRTLPNWPWPVRIRTLGRFSLVVNGEELDLSRQSARPLQLLKLLIARGRTPIPVPELIDTLWPELDGDKGLNNFKVTLSRLRKIIGKDAVLQTDNSVSLSRSQCWVDAWVLEGLVKRLPAMNLVAKDVSDHYQRVLALYQGPLLGRDEDYWIATYRDSIHQSYVACLAELAERFVRHDEALKALEVTAHGLAIDDTAEALYLSQLQAHAALKQKAEAAKLFAQYQKMLRSRFDAEPSPFMRAAYQSAMEAS